MIKNPSHLLDINIFKTNYYIVINFGYYYFEGFHYNPILTHACPINNYYFKPLVVSSWGGLPQMMSRKFLRCIENLMARPMFPLVLLQLLSLSFFPWLTRWLTMMRLGLQPKRSWTAWTPTSRGTWGCGPHGWPPVRRRRTFWAKPVSIWYFNFFPILIIPPVSEYESQPPQPVEDEGLPKEVHGGCQSTQWLTVPGKLAIWHCTSRTKAINLPDYWLMFRFIGYLFWALLCGGVFGSVIYCFTRKK